MTDLTQLDAKEALNRLLAELEAAFFCFWTGMHEGYINLDLLAECYKAADRQPPPAAREVGDGVAEWKAEHWPARS